MAKKLSTNNEARRQRARRARLKRERIERERADPEIIESPLGPVDIAAPLHETIPVEGPGADAFLLVAPDVVEGATSPGDPVPGADHPLPVLLEPMPEPPPQPTPKVEPSAKVKATAQAIAMGIAGIFSAGVHALFAKNPEIRIEIAQLLAGLTGADTPEKTDPLAYLPAVAGFVNGAAVRVCETWSIAIPYQDELVVAGALGVGIFGLVGKPIRPGGVIDATARGHANVPEGPGGAA